MLQMRAPEPASPGFGLQVRPWAQSLSLVQVSQPARSTPFCGGATWHVQAAQ
jgi:hypothetical protein